MFVWDAANTGHIARHDITPEEAEQVIRNNPLDLGCQLRNGEERLLHLGVTLKGRVLMVVVTLREEKIRVVTAFAADKKAKKFYATKRR